MTMTNEKNEEAPKRGRGRPRGSFKEKPDATQRATHGALLDELKERSPLAEKTKSYATRRLSPMAQEALREKLLIEIIAEHPADADHLLKKLKGNPALYTVEHLEACRVGFRALDEIIERKNKPEYDRQDFKALEAELERLKAEDDQESKQWQSAVSKAEACLEQARNVFTQRHPGEAL
jgi:hypothetical protein